MLTLVRMGAAVLHIYVTPVSSSFTLPRVQIPILSRSPALHTSNTTSPTVHANKIACVFELCMSL